MPTKKTLTTLVAAFVMGACQGDPGAEGPAGPSGASCPGGETLMAAGGSFNAYVALTGIQGESVSAGHANEIDVVSLRAFVVSPDGACEPDEPSIYNRFLFSKLTDRATVPLLEHMASGDPIDSAVISIDDGTGALRYEWTLSEVIVVQVETVWSGAVPAEEVLLSFQRIALRYFRQNQDGSLAPAETLCWDLSTDEACGS